MFAISERNLSTCRNLLEGAAFGLLAVGPPGVAPLAPAAAAAEPGLGFEPGAVESVLAAILLVRDLSFCCALACSVRLFLHSTSLCARESAGTLVFADRPPFKGAAVEPAEV